MSPVTNDAVAFYSAHATSFHYSYGRDANRRERLAVWACFLNRHCAGVSFAYDLGCGSGILACELARRGIRTLGLDGAPGMLSIARGSAAEAGLKESVQFLQQRLPLENPTEWPAADLVISSSALEYLPSLPEALYSIRNMMRPGGKLLFSVSNGESCSRAVVRLIHRLTGRPRYFGLLRQFRTPSTLRAELEQAGFRMIEYAHFAKADRINRLLSFAMPERHASNMIIAAATRL
jgi:SAM-dependent methyltransferase